ncbi:MAG: type IV toxin-antitoxin system AbiEi family antitoxin domain-containing protein [Actinomycetota bacterium]|nr:type IV toxin-antitoxin system AbiEi family antitoxin domain-containing protein [Actinomycetota bacterium]
MHTKDPETLCNELASRQRGIITRDQASKAGLSERVIQRLTKSGRWARMYPGVFLVGGAPDSWESRLTGATVGAGVGAAVSHRAAARWLGLEGFDEDIVEITCGRCLRWPGVTVHRGPPLDRRDVMSARGLPITTATRTLCDIALLVSLPRLESALDNALLRGLTSVDYLERRLAEHGQTRRGTAPLKRLLDSRQPGRAPTESELEREFLRAVISRFDLPPPASQVRVLAGATESRLDFAYPNLHLAIEVLGWRFHLGRRSWECDLARHNRLAAEGWTILYFSWFDVTRRPSWVAGQVRRAIEERTALFVSQ